MTFSTTRRVGNNHHQMVLWMGLSICMVTGEGVCVCVCDVGLSECQQEAGGLHHRLHSWVFLASTGWNWKGGAPALLPAPQMRIYVCVWQRRRHAAALAYMQIAFPALPLTAAAVQAQTSSLFLKSVSAVVSALNVSRRSPEDRGPAQTWRISAWMFLSSIMDACLTAGPWCVRREDGGAQTLKGALEFTGAIIHIWGQTCLHVALNSCSECRNLSWCGN